MAVRSPSRYVAEVRGVSNPKFLGLPKDQGADVSAQVATPILEIETLAGEYPGNRTALSLANLNGDVS
jgi:hypothetical protein